MSTVCAGVRQGEGQGGDKNTHPRLRDKNAECDVEKTTIATAIIGFVISLVGGIGLAVWILSWFSSWAIVLRRVLGYP